MRCKRRASNLTGAAKAMAEYDSWIGRGRRMMIDFSLEMQRCQWYDNNAKVQSMSQVILLIQSYNKAKSAIGVLSLQHYDLLACFTSD